MRLSLVSFLIICVLCNSNAQINKYQFSHLDINNGLSHNQVNCIYKDSKGFMWFGTGAGLNRYDGYTFKVFKHLANNENSVIDDYIQNIFEGPGQNLWIITSTGLCIYNMATEKFSADVSSWIRLLKLPGAGMSKIKRDRRGNFWFIYPNSGVYRYDPADKQTYYYGCDKGAKLALLSNNVTDISEDNLGNMWFIYDTGVIEKLNIARNKITYTSKALSKLNNVKSFTYSIMADIDGDLWIYATGANLGVYYLNPRKNILNHFDKASKGLRLNVNVINNVYQDDEGLMWVATDHGGINLIDKKGFKVIYLLNREDDAKSLKQNSVILYKDNTGIMWAGTFKEGISYYHKNIIRFPLYRHFASDPSSLDFEDVDKFVEDKRGNLWIGTNGGGLIYLDRKTGKYTRYKNDPQNNNSLSNDIIVSLCLDHNQTLWIGTYFGGVDSFDGKVFTHHRHDDHIATSIADDRVWSIVEDSSNRLLIGTLAGGLNIFDPFKKIFTRPYNKTQIRSTFVSAILEDKKGNIWVGGDGGIDIIIKKSGHIVHYEHDDNNPNSLISNKLNCILEDSRGLVWIGTRYGLSVFDVKTNRFLSLKKENGLPANLIQNILEDNSGMIWLSTSNGLCRIILTGTDNRYNFRFENFDETDGLQGREFNVNAAFKTSKGELIFGGGHGFNLFNPLIIKPNTNKSKLIFTDLLLFNKSVAADEAINGHVILSKALSETRAVTLNHNENVFTIEFAALNFFNPGKVKYQYMLEGFDKGWITAENTMRKATYTNLDGGTYTFMVRAINRDAVGNTDSISLKINVKPPFWKSTLAYAIYLIVIIGGLFVIRRRGIQKIQWKFAAEQQQKEVERIIEQERKEVERLYEIDRLKTKFLTNVSHEFRTPLSLIMAPVDKMLGDSVNAGQKQQLNMVRKNTRRLLNLVNQLLDFRRMEVQELKLHTRHGDIIKFIEDVSLSFIDIAEEKGIRFVFDTSEESLKTSFDHDKIERILFNLLSNAFKFTPKGGHVSVLLSLVPERSETNLKCVEIKVMDTGIGIPEDRKERIFDRFFQNDLPGSMLNQGSGIGLAITKEFVMMHGGEIFVERDTEFGSCFIVRLPMLLHGAEENVLVDQEADDVVTFPGIEVATKNLSSVNSKQTVLLVEDNEDFRFYLKDNLVGLFHIIEATTGKEGWQKALALHPDIIVSDISMPEMSGKDLCVKVKNDSRTSHIPVILLTALIGEEEELKSLEIGANDYMTKPFNFEILTSKIKNLLRLQATFKKTYTRQLDFKLNEPAIPSTDEKFIKNIIEYVNKNMLDPALSVSELSKYLGLNRNTLYKKLLLITGRSPVEYIRMLRLKKAAYLLEYSQMNISEVSYEVGFNTPQYFAKSFKEEFDMLPSEFVIQKRKQHQDQTQVS
ncbi:hybrid sensor histidine kinase/response regulator transcription factor [Mucilaginibacter sp. SG564]|uniref:hybrid sensor histidine kinase/response regulator transcription factor n=1 Tax=Mucilaginibacter sp. SG564 TaxID=2587022 RepID=UPI0015545859